MKFVKAIGSEQTLRYDSRTTIVVPLGGVMLPDNVAAALEHRCAVEISDAPSGADEIFGEAHEPNPIPDVAKEIQPEPEPEVPTPTVEDLINPKPTE